MILSGELKPGDRLPAERDPEHIRKLEFLQNDVKKALASDINTFTNAFFIYRKTIASLSGNCIIPLIMNAFFTASISAWADYCEYIGRENTYEALVQTTEHIKNGDSVHAIRLFTECIEKYKNHLQNL